MHGTKKEVEDVDPLIDELEPIDLMYKDNL